MGEKYLLSKNNLSKYLKKAGLIGPRTIVNWSGEKGYGMKNIVYFVNIEGKKYSIKVGLFSEGKNEKLNEYNCLKFLKSEYSPSTVFCNSKNNIIIKEYINGKTFQKLNDKLIENLAVLLADLHSKKYSYYGKFCFKPKFGGGKGYFYDQIKYIELVIRKLNPFLPVIASIHLKQIMELLKENIDFSAFNDIKFSLINFDLLPGNILLTPESKLFVIDWGDASIGDPALEIARIFSFWGLTKKQKNKFLNLYNKRIPKNFNNRIEQYLPFISLNNFVWEIKTFHQIKSRKIDENPLFNEHSFLKRIKKHYATLFRLYLTGSISKIEIERFF